MPAILEHSSPEALVAALEANWCDYIRLFGLASQVEIRDDDELLWWITGIPEGSFNGVHRATLRDDTADARIAEAEAHFSARGAPLGWLTGPLSRPADLVERLTARGYRHAIRIPGMAADLAALPEQTATPPGLAIVTVADLATLELWSQAEALGFEASEEVVAGLGPIRDAVGVAPGLPIRRYLGLLDGQPVATASLMAAAGVGGIYDVSTAPAARGRGVGTAITHAAMRDARAIGYQFATLQSSPMGMRMYRRLGFQECGAFDVYA